MSFSRFQALLELFLLSQWQRSPCLQPPLPAKEHIGCWWSSDSKGSGPDAHMAAVWLHHAGWLHFSLCPAASWAGAIPDCWVGNLGQVGGMQQDALVIQNSGKQNACCYTDPEILLHNKSSQVCLWGSTFKHSSKKHPVFIKGHWILLLTVFKVLWYNQSPLILLPTLGRGQDLFLYSVCRAQLQIFVRYEGCTLLYTQANCMSVPLLTCFHSWRQVTNAQFGKRNHWH